MSKFLFPDLREIPFQACSSLLSPYEFDSHIHTSLYDFACLLSEFFQQIKLFANSGPQSSFTYEQLTERSQILINWVDLLAIQYQACLPHIPKTILPEQFEHVLAQVRKVYAHPLLASIWLGLEVTTHVNNTKQENEFLRYIVVASHYEHEIPGQFKQLLQFIQDVVNVDALKTFFDAATNVEIIDEMLIEKFIALSAPILFQIGSLGKMDLAASALEIYSHYLIYLDNIRLKHVYQATFSRIKNKIPASYQHDESIYAINHPVFDAHIATTENYANQHTNDLIVFPKIKIAALPDSIQLLFSKLENNMEFVCTLRGRLIRYKSKNYLLQIKDILHQTILPSQKAHYIELLTSAWYGWVKKRYRDESILINECLSMASALSVKIRDQSQ